MSFFPKSLIFFHSAWAASVTTEEDFDLEALCVPFSEIKEGCAKCHDGSDSDA